MLSETVLETATDEELTGLAGIVAAQHENRVPEWYAGILAAISAVFAIALGGDPSWFHSTGVPVLLSLVLVAVPIVCFAMLRRKTFAADATAVQRVGREPVQAAINVVRTDRVPDWLPNFVRPKPSTEERLVKL